MEFRLLGSFEVEDDGRVLALGRSKPRALLASLPLRANSVVGRDILIDELWGGGPPPSAGHSLEVYVSRLRRVLPGRLEAREGGYLLASRTWPSSRTPAAITLRRAGCSPAR